MANSQINISINAQDNASAQVAAVSNNIANLNAKIINISQVLQGLNVTWDMLGEKLKNFATAGIGANAVLESLQTKLTGLISANSANVTSTGEIINAQQKWQLSSEVASEALERLKSIATATGNQISSTTDAFTMFYATANDQGGTSEALDAFNAIALAAQVAGKDMASLVPMFDSLATGTVLAGSEMGSFMKIVGLTNEELKLANQNGTLFATLQERLAEFSSVAKLSAGTYEMELNKLKSTLTSLGSEASKPVFDSLKNSIAGLNKFIAENKEAILSLAKGLSELGEVLLVAGAGFLAMQSKILMATVSLSAFSTTAVSATGALGAMTAGLTTAGAAFLRLLPVAVIAGLWECVGAIRAVNDETGKLASGLNTIERHIANFLNAFASGVTDLVIGFEKLGYEIDLMLAKIPGLGFLKEGAEQGLEKAELRQKANDEAHLKKHQQINNPITNTTPPNANKAELLNGKVGAKELEVDLKEQEKLYLSYYETIGDLSSAWAIKEKALREQIAKSGITDEIEANKLIQAQKEQYFSRNSTKSTAKSAEQLQKEYEAELRNEIKKYELLKDYENKKLKERELKTLEYQRLGLSEVEMAQVFADEELEIEKESLRKQNDERIKYLEKMSKYYEMLGEKAKAATFANEASALELENQGYSKEQIADMQFGEQRRKDNYNTLSSAMGWNTGVSQQMLSRFNAIDEYLNQEKARIEAHYGELSEMDARYYEKKKALEKAEFIASLGNANTMFSGLGALAKQYYDLSDGQNKSAFRAYQAFQVAQTMISTYASAQEAYRVGGPYLGPVLSAMAIAQGLMNVAQIKAQKYHSGGVVGEAGSGVGYIGGNLAASEVPAILQTGEGVLSRQGMSNLEALNLGLLAQANPQNQEIVILNQVSDGVMEEYLQSRTGRKVIKNIINGG
ncbi:MAG: hypothetical protein SPJ69_07635 [Campylobacter sp.]|uniref:hypothetical protein n=1 Tax=Campylobacter sp. TaxID=205 RepID=UPI002971C4D4|nr:hypothetical protein [Campylobacter sp.]MDD7600628.1 hypothetical protein [Campylobacteraceae bacterium]MDY5888174.1 hypothetical protein [Campylobacter sp.]